jgi:hypothetical protein
MLLVVRYAAIRSNTTQQFILACVQLLPGNLMVLARCISLVPCDRLKDPSFDRDIRSPLRNIRDPLENWDHNEARSIVRVARSC